MNIRTAASFIATLFIAVHTAAHNDGHVIWFDTPVPAEARQDTKEWESRSIPIGNGSIGANIMGSVTAERITLNEKTLWRGGPNTVGGAAYYWNVNRQACHILPEIRRAFAEGDNEKAAELTRNNFNGHASYDEHEETPFRFGSYTSMGQIEVETGIADTCITDYRRALLLDSALCVVSFVSNGTHYERSSFVSYPDSALVMRYTAGKPGMQNLVLRYSATQAARGYVRRTGRNEILYDGRLVDNDMQYAVRVRAINKGGTLYVTDDGRIVVRSADEVMFVVTADTDYKPSFSPDFNNPEAYVGVNPLETTLTAMNRAATSDYNELLRRHEADYTSLFGRVRLDINNSTHNVTATSLPTYRRLERYRNGAEDYALEELYYQFGRYLLISSSRKGSMPANLQGIWADGVDSPWHADYHNNINLQMNYWPALSSNLEECMPPLFDFIRTLIKPGSVTARSYYGARGWTASVSANIFGFASPLSSNDMTWNFSPMAGPWLATHIWEYYDYTRDEDFLRNSYDIIRGSAIFAADYLWHRDDGTYTAAPSTSPEHGPVDSGATFVHAVVREILNDAVKASEILNTDTVWRRQWKHIIKNLAPYRTGRYGQLMEWSEDIDDPEDEHRHVNHLFGLFPGHTVSVTSTPELADAARVVLEHRGDGATGWSMGWKLNLWAHLNDGNHAYRLFRNLLSYGTLDNMWDSHPPFQIDGNFGGTSGINEMLMQSTGSDIIILPSLPDSWRQGSVKGLRARGGHTVEIKWNEGCMVSAEVLSGSDGACSICYRGCKLKINTEKNRLYKIVYTDGTLKLSSCRKQ